MKKLNKKIEIVTACLVISLASVAAHASSKTCSQSKIANLGKMMLVAASELTNELNPVQDRRMAVNDVLRNPRAAQITDPAQVEAIRELAKSSARVFDPMIGGNKLNDFTGAAANYKNSKCYMLTAGHNITSYKAKLVDGQEKMVPDWNKRYFGARIKVEVGFGPGQTRRIVEGTVIKVGDGATNGDFGVIRLDEPVSGGNIKTRVLNPEDLNSAKLMSVGVPGNKQFDRSQWNLFVDAACKKISNRTNENALMTDCLASPGNSGGPVAALTKLADGREVWSISGMIVKGDDSSVVSEDGSRVGASPGQSVNFKAIEAAVDNVIDSDIRKTKDASCKEDASFLDQKL